MRQLGANADAIDVIEVSVLLVLLTQVLHQWAPAA